MPPSTQPSKLQFHFESRLKLLRVDDDIGINAGVNVNVNNFNDNAVNSNNFNVDVKVDSNPLLPARSSTKLLNVS